MDFNEGLASGPVDVTGPESRFMRSSNDTATPDAATWPADKVEKAHAQLRLDLKGLVLPNRTSIIKVLVRCSC